MRDNVPSARYSSICNVLRQWRIWLIATYRVYQLYNNDRGLKNKDISQLGGDVLELGGAKYKNTWLVCGIGCSCKI